MREAVANDDDEVRLGVFEAFRNFRDNIHLEELLERFSGLGELGVLLEDTDAIEASLIARSIASRFYDVASILEFGLLF